MLLNNFWPNLTSWPRKILLYLYVTVLLSFFTLLGSGLVFLFFWGVPIIESRFFPVVENFEILNITEDEDYFIIYGHYDKMRLCIIDSLDIISNTSEGFNAVQYELSTTVPTNRPLGHNIFGPWKLSKEFLEPEMGGPIPITVIMHHSCTGLWLTTTTVGPFDLGSIPEINVDK